MDPLTLFWFFVFLSSLEVGERKGRRWAVDFVRDRAIRWGPVYSAGMAGHRPDQIHILDQIWEDEEREARELGLLSDWADAHDLLDRRDKELFRRLVIAYASGGASTVRQLAVFGAAPVLRSPIGDVLPYVTSPFGYRTSPVTGEAHTFHEGVDLRAAAGTPVKAPADGTVAWVGDSGRCGWGMEISHSPTLKTTYCHLSRRDVKKGDAVRAGQQIGLSGGSKGHPGAGSSTAAHLHFAVHTRSNPDAKWKAVDPVPLIQAQAQEQESWFDWVASFWPFSFEEEPTGPVATVVAGPGASFSLVGSDGVEWTEGEVPAGTYELRVGRVSPIQVKLEANKTYRVSAIGGLFPG